MIKKTLEAMSQSKSKGELARRLGISEDDLEGRLDVFRNMGYISVSNENKKNSSACILCPSFDSCTTCPGKGPLTYALTSKGKKILRLV